MEEKIGAVAVELTSEDLHEIDSAVSKVEIQGVRYPEELEKGLAYEQAPTAAFQS